MMVAKLLILPLLLLTGLPHIVRQCPVVKTNIESWDLSVWNGVSVQFHNASVNEAWNITMCQFVMSQTFDWGNFEGGAGSVQFHEPSDTFFMLYEGGDRGEGCQSNPRQAAVYVHCRGCPPPFVGCQDGQVPCVCAAWDDGCISEVHMHDVCPVGNPKYRVGFDVYDASTGIEADVSKVVVKDGEILPAWRDESIPEVKMSRAVIPGDTKKALFFLMMSEGSTENTDFDPPDVFTDQTDILRVTVDGSGSNGGTVTPDQMQTVQLNFDCLRSGLADVHVEISFGDQYYPCDFAFTYDCMVGIGGGTSGGSNFLMTVALIMLIFGCVAGYGYNVKVHGKEGIDALPAVEAWQPILIQGKDMIAGIVATASEKLESAQGDTGGAYETVSGTDDATRGFQEEDESFGII